jgi:hypothetical protein
MGTEGVSRAGSRVGKRSKRLGLVGLIAAAMLAVPATSFAATPELFFNFPAGHGYTLLGTASTSEGHGAVSIQLDKTKFSGSTFNSQTYSFSGFTGTYSATSTKATLSANLGSYGSVDLKFTGTSKEKGKTIKCPGSNKKTTIDKGVELGKVSGSLTFDSQISYFGTIKGHSSKSSFLEKESSFLARRESVDPQAIAARSGSGSSGLLACIPSLSGKLTYLDLAPQGASSSPYNTSEFFAARFGDDTDLSASTSTFSLTGGPILGRTIAENVIGKSAGNKVFSFSGLSSGTAKASGSYLSGTASYHETTPCENTSSVTYGTVAGAITAKFDAGGYVTYGGAGTVGEMDKLPGPTCDNPPTGAPG